MTGSLVLISIGAARTRLARVDDGALQPSTVLDSADASAVADRAVALVGEVPDTEGDATVVIAAGNADAAQSLERELGGRDVRVLRFGRELEIPITHALDNDAGVGQDRLLSALGAFARSKQACIVVDAGAAITVDFVDGEGAFQGGAIAPGLSQMLDALRAHDAGLPAVRLTPELMPKVNADGAETAADVAPPFGRNTSAAMIAGVVAAARGTVHHLVDRYAEFYEAYPRVIATGPDAPMLFENDAIVEHIVPDLALVGMLEAIKTLESLDEADGGAADERD